ncbi:MAG: hypothetical protein ACREDO_00280 [Methyloceanibacter sp.]
MPQRIKTAAVKAQDTMMPALSLSELCSEAADHVAKARISLFDESYDAEQALLHLDEAIFCLKRLSAHGRSPTANGSPQSLRSA